MLIWGGNIVKMESGYWRGAKRSPRFTTWLVLSDPAQVTCVFKPESPVLKEGAWSDFISTVPGFRCGAGACSVGPHSLPLGHATWYMCLRRCASQISEFSSVARTNHAGNTEVKRLAFAHSFLASIFHYSPTRINSLEACSWKKGRSGFSGESVVQPWPTLLIAFATT